MVRAIRFLSFILFYLFVLISGLCYGQEGEEALFRLIVEPDALFALDLSGSMNATPWGDYLYSNSKDGSENCNGDRAYGTPQGAYSIQCESENYVCADSDACTGPYYKASSTKPVRCQGNRVDCSKAGIAKRAIKALLDDDGHGGLTKKDQESLGIRVAYMRFKNCNTVEDPISSPNYRSGCNQLLYEFKDLRTNNYYADFYSTIETDIDAGFANFTPLRAQLLEAKAYLNDHKNGNASRGMTADPLKDCRKKFVFFITDGWDTLACDHCYGCDENSTGSYGYKRRRATIKAVKEVADAGYKVFVIGFGADMPDTERYTLEWAAKFAGTNNPMVDDSPITNNVEIVDNPCLTEGACSGNHINCTTAPNDPGYAPLSGYAFLATNAASLNQALRRAMEYVKEARYSFTVSSVSAARVLSENFLYEASFIPLESDPFWLGHLKKYEINQSGEVVRPAALDAGDNLKGKPAASRNIWTYFGGTTLTAFDTSISPTYFGYNDDLAGQNARNAVVGYIRGEVDNNKDNWKLGDIFHSNPITIASPPVYYNDFRSPAAYATHRANNKDRERLVVVGANDGQFHAFSASTLDEKWSFIPPNLLPKLKLLAHSTEPAPIPNHQFFVDGPVTVAEAWLGSGDGVDPPAGSGKNAGEWRTLLIFGLGKGARESHANSDPTYLWSSSDSCNSDFSRKYNPPHRYYCGYYAFDVTNTGQAKPTYAWRINVSDSSQGYYLDEPWSKMVTGRVRIDGNEKWVGFIGGGFSGDDIKKNRDYADDDFETKGKRGGKGFHVIDLSNGNILWSYTRGIDSNMDYPIPASPAVVDWDSDGFIDTAYIADLGGNLWRFRFCSYQDYRNGQSCNTDDWKGGRLYASAGERPVFTRPTVAPDQANQLWVFWGTGNKMVPASTGAQDRFFALKDTFVPAKSGDTPPSYTISNLQNITSTSYAGVLPGWYILLPGSGEKSLSAPTVFGGMVLFTTYTPASTTAITCTSAGTGSLYAVAMMPMAINGVMLSAGTGLWANGGRSISLGTGVPTSPIISQKPAEQAGATDVFVTVSGGGGTETVTRSLSELIEQRGSPARTRLEETPPQAQITHWRDRRVR